MTITTHTPTYPRYIVVANYTFLPSLDPIDTDITCEAVQGQPYDFQFTSPRIAVHYEGSIVQYRLQGLYLFFKIGVDTFSINSYMINIFKI